MSVIFLDRLSSSLLLVCPYKCNRFCIRDFVIWHRLASCCIIWFLTWSFLVSPLFHRKKGKGSFYIAQYPVRWTAQSALHCFALPDRPVHCDTNSASPGSILARQQLRAKTKSLTFPPLSIARYSFLQLSQLGRQWRERKCPNFETVERGIRTEI